MNDSGRKADRSFLGNGLLLSPHGESAVYSRVSGFSIAGSGDLGTFFKAFHLEIFSLQKCYKAKNSAKNKSVPRCPCLRFTPFASVPALLSNPFVELLILSLSAVPS